MATTKAAGGETSAALDPLALVLVPIVQDLPNGSVKVNIGGQVVDLTPILRSQAAVLVPALAGSLGSLLPMLLPLLLKRGGGSDGAKPEAPAAPLPSMPLPSLIDEDIPDPRPAALEPFKVVRVRAALCDVQLQFSRFPKAYTEDNPHGLASREELAAIVAGKTAMCYGSKFWLDLTALYLRNGLEEEVRPALVREHGLQYQTEFHALVNGVEHTFLLGHGGQPGAPNPYEVGSGPTVNQGTSCWASEATLGFKHQFKAWGESNDVEVWGKVAGVESNHIRFRVS